MRDLSLGRALRAALLAGLVAGLLVASFHFVVTEPLIERAIALEEQASQAEGSHEAPLVSRDAQRGGLVLGFLLYGLTWALLLGATYPLVQRWLPTPTPWRRGLLLALAGYWSVALFPSLKYPANPPGVGDPETIALRQSLYLGCLALSIGGTIATLALGRYLAERAGSRRLGWGVALAAQALYAIVVYLALPANPDPVRLPLDLVDSFRWLSLVGLTLFWAVLGCLFGVLVRQPRYWPGG